MGILEHLRRVAAEITDGSLADIRTKRQWLDERPRRYREYLEMQGMTPLPPPEQRTPLDVRVTGTLERDAIYWHYPHYHGSGNRPSGAVRAGDYKLIEWYEDGQTELYNLKDDLSEQKDLATTRPEKTAELRRMLHAWHSEMDAKMPVGEPRNDFQTWREARQV